MIPTIEAFQARTVEAPSFIKRERVFRWLDTFAEFLLFFVVVVVVVARVSCVRPVND
jgi:hypothetical protein